MNTSKYILYDGKLDICVLVEQYAGIGSIKISFVKPDGRMISDVIIYDKKYAYAKEMSFEKDE